jgi:hypothetical protein
MKVPAKSSPKIHSDGRLSQGRDIERRSLRLHCDILVMKRMEGQDFRGSPWWSSWSQHLAETSTSTSYRISTDDRSTLNERDQAVQVPSFSADHVSFNLCQVHDYSVSDDFRERNVITLVYRVCMVEAFPFASMRSISPPR